MGGGSSLLDKAPAANHSGALPRLSADISHFQSRPASPPRLHLSKLALATLLALASCHHLAFAAREQPDSNNFIKQPAPNTGIEIINDGTYNVAAGFELKDLTTSILGDYYGALYSRTNNVFLQFTGSADFLNNTLNRSGAIDSIGAVTVTGGTGPVSFSNNTARTGGAIYSQGAVTVTTEGAGNISFSNNKATEFGGAIYSLEAVTITGGAGNVSFSNNKATGFGGAIYTNNGLDLTARGGDITFEDNTADGQPNAIYVKSNSPKLNLKAAKDHQILFADPISGWSPKNITTTINQSAPDQEFAGTIEFSRFATTLGNVTQHNGTLKVSAGATLNTSSYTHATGNESTLALAGKSRFTSQGNLHLPAHTTNRPTIDVTGTGNSISAPTVTFAPNATINFNVDTSTAEDAAMLTLEDTSQDAADKVISIDGVKLNVVVTGSIANAKTIRLLEPETGTTLTGEAEYESNLYSINCDPSTGKCSVAVPATTPAEDDPSTDEDSGDTSSNQDIPSADSDPDSSADTDDDLTVIITPKPHPIEDMGGNANQAAAFAAFSTGNFAPDSFEYQLFYGAGGLQEALQQGSGRAGLNALSTLFPYDAPVVLDNARATTDFITKAAWYGTTPQTVVGQTSDATMWLRASAATADADDFDAGAFGYDIDRTHLALGLETALNANWKLGVGYAYGYSDMDSLQRSADSESHSFFGYAQYHHGPWRFNGLLSAGFADYDEDAQALNQQLTADYRATSLYGAMMVGYELTTARGAVTPELGLSLLSVDVSDYDTSTGWDVAAERATLTSAIAGLRWEIDAYRTTDWELLFTGGLHARYDLSTTGLDYEVTLSNGSSVSIVGEEPDRLALLPSLGAKLSAGNFALKALLSGTVSDSVTAKALSLDFSYRF